MRRTIQTVRAFRVETVLCHVLVAVTRITGSSDKFENCPAGLVGTFAAGAEFALTAFEILFTISGPFRDRRHV